MGNNNNNQNSGLDGREVPAVIFLVGGATWYKYGHNIQVWFFENMITIAFSAVGLLALLGYFLYMRMKKKDEEEINRMQRLANAKAPTRHVGSYYERKSKDRDLE